MTNLDIKIYVSDGDNIILETVELSEDQIPECVESCELKENLLKTSSEKFFSVEEEEVFIPYVEYDLEKVVSLMDKLNLSEDFKCGAIDGKDNHQVWCEYGRNKEKRAISIKAKTSDQVIRFLEYHFEKYRKWQ